MDDSTLDEGKVISIDEEIEKGEIKKDPTFIKMDIEGAEQDALYGMRKLLKRSHPKLAISIYHLDDDLWKIPVFCMDALPEHSFIIRHHSGSITDTVLYAFESNGEEK